MCLKTNVLEDRVAVTRGERGGDYRGNRLRVYRNNFEGHMDNNKGEGGNRGGRWGRLGWNRGKGRKLYLNNNKKS